MSRERDIAALDGCEIRVLPNTRKRSRRTCRASRAFTGDAADGKGPYADLSLWSIVEVCGHQVAGQVLPCKGVLHVVADFLDGQCSRRVSNVAAQLRAELVRQ